MVHPENHAQRESKTPTGTPGRAFWIAAAITVINVLTSAGFAVAALLAHGGTYAEYAAARSLPLAATALGVVVLRARNGLAALAVTAGLVQACDAVVGARLHDAGRTFGPAVMALATLAAAWPLVRSPR